KKLYQFGLLPEDEVIQAAQRAKLSGFSKALIIAPKSAWGSRLVNAFLNEWQHSGGKVIDSWRYTTNGNFNSDIAKLLKVDPILNQNLTKEELEKYSVNKQKREDFDVIFL